MPTYYTKTANDLRNRYLSQGDQNNADITTDIGRYQGAYGSNYNAAEQALSDLQQTPGYTQDEQNQIMRSKQFQDLLNSPDYNSNYLSPEEQAGIAGNPNAAFQAFDPNALYAAGEQGAQATRGAVSDTAGKLDQNVQQTGAGLKAAIDPSQLGLSSDYQQNVGNVLTTTANRVEGSIDPAKLGISDQYKQAMQFTPQDQKDIEEAAGTSEGARFGGEEQQLQQKAIQQGNTSPAALAAMQERLNTQEGSAAGDAMTNARIAAKQAAMNAAQQEESTRLGSEQYQTGAGMQAGEALGNLAAQEVGQQENLRLSSAQDIANRKAQAALATGQMGQQAGEFTGQQGLTNEQQIAARNLGIEQGVQQTGQNLLTQADQTASQRAGELASNRQGVNLSNQANQFNRGFQVNQQQSGAATGVANQRIAGQGRYLQGVTGQENMAQQGAQTARGQQLENNQISGNLANQALNTGLAADNANKARPGTAEKVVGAAIGAAAGAGYEDGGIAGLNGPELGIVGERGPEQIVPLDPMLDKAQQPPDAIAAPQEKGISISEPDDNFDYQPYSGPGGGSGQSWQKKLSGALTGGLGAWSGTPSGTNSGRYTPGTQPQQGMNWFNIGQAAGAAAAGKFEDGGVVSKPTMAILGENGPEAVVPFNRTPSTKVSSTLFTPEKGVRSRYRHPTGPAGPHGPMRSLEPLAPLKAYR